MSDATTSASAPVGVPIGRRHHSRFFAGMAAILLAIMLTGFAPTLYLRNYFQAPELPLHLFIHGSVMTLWFTLLLVQTGLTRRNRMAWHRYLGLLGMWVAVAVVVTSTLAAFGQLETTRMQFRVTDPQPVGLNPVERKSAEFFSTMGLILVFAVLTTAAILQVHKPAVHKRLMLIGSAAVVGAAAYRWTFLLTGLGVSPEISFAIGGQAGTILPLILIASIAVYDKVIAGRVLAATLWGAGITVVLRLLVFQLRNTDVALAWVSKMMH